MKQKCVKCKKTKAITEFAHDKNRPFPRTTCKACRHASRDKEKENARHREYQRERRKADPKKMRQQWEKAVYGACKEDFGYAECWVCGSTKKLSIDHCHNTKAVRGLLCGSCNLALGLFTDSVAKMKRAIEYLETGPHLRGKRNV